MTWIRNTVTPSRHTMMVSSDAFFLFYEGKHSLDEIQSAIDAGEPPATFIPDSGEVFHFSDIEYLAYDPTKKSLKIHQSGDKENQDRFIDDLAQDKAHDLMMMAKTKWDGFTYTEAAYPRLSKSTLSITVVAMIAFIVIMLCHFYEKGSLTDPDGSSRMRIFLLAVGWYFQTVGKIGVIITGILISAYFVWDIRKTKKQNDPPVPIVHRSNIEVSASDAVDRDT